MPLRCARTTGSVAWMDERLLLPEEVAERLRVSRTTVMRLLRDRKLIGIKTGKLWRVRERDLEAFIRAREHGGAETILTQAARSSGPYQEHVPLPDRVGEVRHTYQTDDNPPKGARCRAQLSWADQDSSWLDADLADLPPYDWGPSGPPKARPVRYVPGVGLVVEGGKFRGK